MCIFIKTLPSFDEFCVEVLLPSIPHSYVACRQNNSMPVNKKSSLKNPSSHNSVILTRSQASRQNLEKGLQSEGDMDYGENIYSNSESGEHLSMKDSSIIHSFRSETTITLTPSAAVTVRKDSIPFPASSLHSNSYCNLSEMVNESAFDMSSFSPLPNQTKSASQVITSDLFGECLNGASVIKHDDHNTPTGAIPSNCYPVEVINDSNCSPLANTINLLSSSTPAPPHLNNSLPESNLSHEGKLDKIISLIETNSSEIKSLRSDFNLFKLTQTETLLACEKKIEDFEDWLNSEISATKINCRESLARLDSELQQRIQSKFDQCSNDQVFDYVDDRINEKFCELDDQIAPRLISAGIEIDKKIDHCKDSLQGSVLSHIQTYLSSKEGKEYLSGLINQSPSNETCQLIDGAYTKLRSEVMETIGQLKFMQCQFIQELRALKENGSFETVTPGVSDTQMISKKIDKIASWIETLQQQFTASSKVLSSLDLKSRKMNLIFDGIPEEPREDLFHFIGSLLTQFVPGFDYNSIDNVFRLGRGSTTDQSTRRVLVSFNSTQAREAVLGQSGTIARAGPPGGRIYINEDIPEDVKRRRADVFKYVDYMYEKGYNVVQKGDSVLLNNTVYKYEDLSAMPKGMTLADSRTIAKKG